MPGQKEKRAIFVTIVVGAVLVCTLHAVTQDTLNYQLSEAVGCGDIKRAGILLDEGADPNAPYSGYSFQDKIYRIIHPYSFEGCSVLWGARRRGDTAMQSLLLKHGSKAELGDGKID